MTRDEVLSHLAGVVGTDPLVRALNPKRRRYDERVAQETVRSKVTEAIRRLGTLGFVELVEGERIRLRPSLMRFAEPVRGAKTPEAALAKLVAEGELVLAEDLEETPDADDDLESHADDGGDDAHDAEVHDADDGRRARRTTSRTTAATALDPEGRDADDGREADGRHHGRRRRGGAPMNRARATALALVNWKGVFYERYLLDRHVTALEGSNGAGKTTVMIGAYVVLLPDLTRLRFTNLGEGSATGGDRGIWGRLGEAGRPAYAALEIEAGERAFVCGVHLARKSEPTLELTPFLIEGLRPEGRLKELLLLDAGDHDEVPELAELRENVTRRGGTIEVFASAKEYFAALFERGITPLRLATDEERNKLNEMLRTSMTGGISRALTNDLRSFLLKEASGLSDPLSRMRQNLDACHRTRTEVGEARLLSTRSPGSTTPAGDVRRSGPATRERDREAAARLAREPARRRRRALDALEASLLRTREAHTRCEACEGARDRAGAPSPSGPSWPRRALGRRVTELATELARATPRRATHGRPTRRRGGEGRATRRAIGATVRSRRDRRGRSGEGLEELHRSAHAHRRVARLLEETRAATGDASLDEGTVAGALERARA